MGNGLQCQARGTTLVTQAAGMPQMKGRVGNNANQPYWQGLEYWDQRTYQVPSDQVPGNLDHKALEQTPRRGHSWTAGW